MCISAQLLYTVYLHPKTSNCSTVITLLHKFTVPTTTTTGLNKENILLLLYFFCE